MELEAREIEPARRQRCRSKVDCYRTELKRLTLEYIKARSVKQSALSCESADELEDGFVTISENQKKRLLDHSERIERSNNRLEEGYKICLETEEIGSQVLDELSDQREVIQRARNRVSYTWIQSFLTAFWSMYEYWWYNPNGISKSYSQFTILSLCYCLMSEYTMNLQIINRTRLWFVSYLAKDNNSKIVGSKWKSDKSISQHFTESSQN